MEFVTGATILPDGVTTSDHAAICVCLDREQLLGKDPTCHRTPPRQVTFKTPEAIRRYRASVEKYFRDHKLLDKIQLTKETFATNPQLDDAVKTEMLDQLDEEATRYMLAAEKKC